MEVALLHSSAADNHGSMSASKRMRNPKRSIQARPLIPSRSKSESSQKMVNGGVYLNPPFPFYTSLPSLNSSPYPLGFQQPPLLPLPMAVSSSSFRQFRSHDNSSLSPTHKKQNKGKKKVDPVMKSDLCSAGNTNRLDSLPKDIKKVDKFSGSIFPSAPPPSSLPMPKFPLKPKVSCKVEANRYGESGLVDTGATDNLCRLLNIR